MNREGFFFRRFRQRVRRRLEAEGGPGSVPTGLGL